MRCRDDIIEALSAYFGVSQSQLIRANLRDMTRSDRLKYLPTHALTEEELVPILDVVEGLSLIHISEPTRPY